MKFIPTKMTFIHMKSFIYGHIHPCMWIKITLSFKLEAQALCSCTSHHQSLFFQNHTMSILFP